jgi:hypothetical protein
MRSSGHRTIDQPVCFCGFLTKSGLPIALTPPLELEVPMVSKAIHVLALVGMTATTLAVVGCSPNDNNSQPYSLTGTSSTYDQRFVDQKSHYRPDLAMTNNTVR